VPEEKVSTPKGKKTLHLQKTTTSQARIARSSARRISNSELPLGNCGFRCISRTAPARKKETSSS
jgi:hypothetical protein